MAAPLLIARSTHDLCLLPGMANRHGLIAGATGTGKTVTLHALATKLSEIGVPVFLADVKGDLAGISQPGTPSPRLTERLIALGLSDFPFTGYPVLFWDLYGAQGHPVRTTVSEMGPLLLARLLGLNETQTGVMQLAFKWADDQGLLLLDLKDLRALLKHVGEHRDAFTVEYGNVAPQTIGAIQRALLGLEEEGGERFFGEPALNFHDFIRHAPDGRGMISILAADRLIRSPKIYATFLLWLLAELFEHLPEVGDPAQPRLVFFFDEAHLLFNDAPKALRDKIEQVVRLIRSKGVGVYFVSQSPLDIPDVILGQLGNRVQHALRAFTPRDQKAVRAAAETFRANPGLDVATAITELAVGEALVSFLDAQGTPQPVERALILPPQSRMGPISAQERAALIGGSLLRGWYERVVDRESAYEILQRSAQRPTAVDEAAPPPPPAPSAPPPPAAPILATAASADGPEREIGRKTGDGLLRGLLGSLIGRGR